MKYGEEAVFALLEVLNSRSVPYMLVGSFSSNAYGEPRSTKDADFVINLPSDERFKLTSALPDEFIVDQQVNFETITGNTRQILKIPTIPFEIELFDLSRDPFDQSRFERRLKTSMGGHVVWLPTAEDVIVQKLRWAQLGSRDKDFLDAQGILRVRNDLLDWEYITYWSKKLSLQNILDELRS